KNILNFEKDFKDAITVKLEQNYRSTKNILDAANSVIKHNKQRKDKNLITDNDKGKKVKYIKTNNEIDEAIYVVKKIKDIVKENSDYDKIAILYRTNAQSRIIEEEMLKGSIPYRIVGSFYFYNRKEIKDLLCYLRLLINEKDDISFLRVINTPKRGIGTKTISNLETRAKELGVCLYDATINGKELGFKQLLEDMRSKIETMSLTEIVDMVLNNSGMKEDLKKQKTIEAEIRLENLEEFKSITKSYEENLGVVSLKDFLEELTLVSDMAEHNDAPNQVTLMTIHAVKGLEFDYVFVVGLEEGIFPHFNAIMDNSSSAIEEERRLCYVAITRAKKELYLLNAKRRMLFGKEQINPTSRFINEIDNDYLEKEKSSEKIRITDFIKKNMFNNHDTDYQIGDKVKHTEFGNGIITSVDKSIITIAFSYPYGIKKMMKNHKSISKI
ncbi:MAG: 3'-5' exonuclease, partial [bacterium]|nr:3'-5' exonuclease [bacterium]